jgi:hypothetical protein
VDHGDRGALQAAAAELVAQRALEHVADRPLQVGGGEVHGHRRHLGQSELRAPQDEPHLRAAAMSDNHVPAGGDHLGDVLRRGRGGRGLIGDRFVLAIEDQRIAADGDHRGVGRHGIGPPVA